jgi:hypothetical protein
MDINLEQIIALLNQRFDELNNYSFSEPDPVERNRKVLELHKRATDLNEEITKYERIRANSAAATITINPVSDQERQELESALNSLNNAIQQDEVWHRALGLATALLEAAAKIRSKSASPQAAPRMGGAMAFGAGAVMPRDERINKLLARHAKPGARPGRAKRKSAKGKSRR